MAVGVGVPLPGRGVAVGDAPELGVAVGEIPELLEDELLDPRVDVGVGVGEEEVEVEGLGVIVPELPVIPALSIVVGVLSSSFLLPCAQAERSTAQANIEAKR